MSSGWRFRALGEVSCPLRYGAAPETCQEPPKLCAKLPEHKMAPEQTCSGRCVKASLFSSWEEESPQVTSQKARTPPPPPSPSTSFDIKGVNLWGGQEIILPSQESSKPPSKVSGLSIISKLAPTQH